MKNMNTCATTLCASANCGRLPLPGMYFCGECTAFLNAIGVLPIPMPHVCRVCGAAMEFPGRCEACDRGVRSILRAHTWRRRAERLKVYALAIGVLGGLAAFEWQYVPFALEWLRMLFGGAR